MGTDGKRIVYPIRGMGQAAQRVVDRTNATTVYVALLATTAFATAAALLAAGERIDAPHRCARTGSGRGSGRTQRDAAHASTSSFPSQAFRRFSPPCSSAHSQQDSSAPPRCWETQSSCPAIASRAPRLKWASYTSIRFIVGALTGLAAQTTIAFVPSDFGGLVAATLVATVLREAPRHGFYGSYSLRPGCFRDRNGSVDHSLCWSSGRRSTRRSSHSSHSCTSTSRPGRSRSSSRQRLLRRSCTRYTRRSANSPPISRW